MRCEVALGIYIFFPALIIYLCCTCEKLNKIGAVIFCYIGGIGLGNSAILPGNVLELQEIASEGAVAIALPLLLFSINIKKWSRLAGKTMLSMCLAIMSIILVSVAGFYLICAYEPEPWQLAGMSVSVYTGGTPNLASIKSALNIAPERYIVVHTYDTLISFFYIIFCITIAQRLFNRFLPLFTNKSNENQIDLNERETQGIQSYQGIFKPAVFLNLLLALLLSAAIVGLSLLAGSLLPAQNRTPAIILLITSLAIAASCIPRIHNIEKTFQLGMYIIYIFCFIVGSMVKFDTILNINIPVIIFITASVFGSMAIHGFLCKILNVDTDTYIITSVSAICSPPFVPVVAGALKNREIILSGLTTGIIGYAIGNYLGVFVALALRALA
ncbi:MAG: DUF819 family protein [Desulfobacteraceae bacterium]|nr:DUF819 family protein [Desulfobacteraceae bacterium]